jgi:hypothetical protein
LRPLGWAVTNSTSSLLERQSPHRIGYGMRAVSSYRGWWLPTGVVLSLLVNAVFAPAAARASCGDYLIPSHHTSGQAEASLMGLAGKIAPAGQPMHSHAPCSGPNCSRRPVLPLVPVAPLGVSAPQWACSTARPDFLVLEGSSFFRDGPVPSPSSHDDSIFHPPR